jgi:dipeptidyl aminopeptidase/acylaminoacyl peptidase
MNKKHHLLLVFVLTLAGVPCVSLGMVPNEGTSQRFEPMDVFGLEYASDPRISPDGDRVVYQRNFMDVMSDMRRSNLWIVHADGSNHRPLTSGNYSDSSPRWSPDGERLLYVSNREGTAQLYLCWMDTGQTARLTQLGENPSGLAWSPDGKLIAFSMLVQEKREPFAAMPSKPEGAEWAPPVKVIDRLIYRADGQGYLKQGHRQLFVLSSDGGTPRQLTRGPYHHGGNLVFTPDGSSILFSANRNEDWEYDTRNSEIYDVSVQDGTVRALTDRNGPDEYPAISPDGRRIAYLGFDDTYQFYQVKRLFVMNRDGSNSRLVSSALDRDVQAPVWSDDGRGIFFQYDDEGQTKIAHMTLDGEVQDLVGSVGGMSLGRPYSDGQYSVASNSWYAFTLSRPDAPSDVAIGRRGTEAKSLTALNVDLLGHKELAAVEEIWYESSHDERRIQGWIAKPFGFDPSKKYPLLLEIHGGPVTNYGPHFSAEVQLYAAAGYVVLYTNPRGSNSYGQEFGNLIHRNYPGEDYDDLMSGVDAVIARGYIDDRNLFVTGGSGGGVLTSWVVGRTDRFRAAVSAKPVINWYSWVLTTDIPSVYKSWFPGLPWEHEDHYMRRSPISLVGNVTTPTMVLTGEQDYRTPMSDSEQYYQALKLRKIDTALVRIPGASHGITDRPSHLIAKVANIVAWFDKYRTESVTTDSN